MELDRLAYEAVRDAIEQIDALTVYEIARGRGFELTEEQILIVLRTVRGAHVRL